jgi:hypothetical protein
MPLGRPFDGFVEHSKRVSPTCLIHFERNRYSVPASFANRPVTHPQRQLAGYTGFLQADAYAGYNKLYESSRVTEVACWAHFRRKIFDIHQTKPTALTTDLLERIGALYAIEADVARAPARHATIRASGSITPSDRATAPGARRRAPSPLAQIRDGEGDCLWRQALAGAHPLPRRWSPRDRQQHRRTRAAQHRHLGVILPMLGKTSRSTTVGIRISDANFAARTAKNVRPGASSISSSRPGMSLPLRPG